MHEGSTSWWGRITFSIRRQRGAMRKGWRTRWRGCGTTTSTRTTTLWTPSRGMWSLRRLVLGRAVRVNIPSDAVLNIRFVLSRPSKAWTGHPAYGRVGVRAFPPIAKNAMDGAPSMRSSRGSCFLAQAKLGRGTQQYGRVGVRAFPPIARNAMDGAPRRIGW